MTKRASCCSMKNKGERTLLCNKRSLFYEKGLRIFAKNCEYIFVSKFRMNQLPKYMYMHVRVALLYMYISDVVHRFEDLHGT